MYHTRKYLLTILPTNFSSSVETLLVVTLQVKHSKLE